MSEKTNEHDTSPDVTQEAADIRRLIEAGTRTDDPETTAAGIARAGRLKRTTGLDITNPTVASILKLDTVGRTQVKK